MVWFVVEGIDSGGAAAQGKTYYDLLMKSGSPLVGKTVVPTWTTADWFALESALKRYGTFCSGSAVPDSHAG
jgi:hypothetical protein